jgi:hypothetical protein
MPIAVHAAGRPGDDRNGNLEVAMPLTPWYRDPMLLIPAIGLLVLATGIFLSFIGTANVRQELTAKGFVEVRYKGQSVFVRPEDTHRLLEVSQ